MASQSSSSMFLPKPMWLEGEENYEDWKDNITLFLGSKGLAKFIRKGSIVPDSDSDEIDSQRMTCAMSIKGSMHPEPAVGLKGVTNPAEMIRLLDQRFTSTGWNLKHKYLTEYNTLRAEHYDSIGAFIDQFKVLKSKLDTIGLPLPEEVYTINFIALLDAQYPVWADRQRSNARKTPPILLDLIADILDESRKAEKATTALYSGKPAANKSRRGGGNKEAVKCGHCGKQGHEINSCWVKHPEKRPPGTTPRGKRQRGAKKDNSNDAEGNEKDSALSVVALSTKDGLDRHSWCFDGGAALHITHTRANFDLYTPNDGSLPTILTANGPTTPLGSGIVRLEIEGSDSKPLKLELKDVLHLPSVPVNLFSGQLFEKRTSGGYLKKGVLYTGSDEPVALIETTGSGHFLKVVKEPMFTHALLSSVSSTKPKSLDLWHRRLLHASIGSVKETAQMAKGISIEAGQSEPGLCRTCQVANSIRNVSRTPQLRRQNVFELVHVDIEKISPVGFNGHTWASIFTEDATRARWAWTFKEKKDAHQSIVHFDKLVQTQWNTTVKAYRIDGGKEYGGQKLVQHIKERGTLAEVTTPYTPEQNGVAERANRTIFSKVRSAIQDSDLPQELWPEILLSAVHVTNRTATSSLEKMTPAEAFKRQVQPGLRDADYSPDISHLRVLGCKVYLNIPKERRVKSAKLAPHAEEGYLVGFEGSKIYRVYLPGRAQKIVRTSHCVFDESEPENPETPDVHMPSTISDEGSMVQKEDGGLDQKYDPLTTIVVDIEEEQEDRDTSPPPTPRGRGRPKGSKNKPKDLAPSTIRLCSETPSQTGLPDQIDQEESSQGSGDEMAPNHGSQDQTPLDLSNRRITRSHTQGNPALFATALLATQVSGYLAAVTDREEPKSVLEAKESPDWSHWLEAMRAELKSLVKNKTWRAVSVSKGYLKAQGKKALGAKWVFKIKRGSDSQIIQYKARWVVKGYEQRYGLDYDQTFAGVVRAATWRLILGLAAANDWAVDQMDVKSAFLHGDIDEEVYVDLPEGWELFPDIFQSGEIVLLLQKALYGLKQSPRLWQLTLKAALKRLGYLPLFADQCVYRNASTGLIIITYVDDFLLIGPHGQELQQLKRQLSNAFEMKDLGPCQFFLGVRITRKGSQITLCQDAYIRKVLDQFGMLECRAVTTPLDPGASDTLVPYQGSAAEDQIKLYQSLVGCINYLATQTRCDIAFTASALSRFLVNPAPAHIKSAKRALQYLKGTIMYSITLGGPKYGPNNLDIRLYTDSDYAGDRHTYKSTSGYVSFVAGGPVSWQSKRQSVVAQSSTEAEYIAMSELAKEGSWIRYLLEGLKYKGQDLESITLFGDNQGALSLAENPTFHRGSKHIAVRYHLVRQEVEEGRLQLAYIPTDHMPADGLTKALKTPAHMRFVRLLTLIKEVK
jgi:hypothetical protein